MKREDSRKEGCPIEKSGRTAKIERDERRTGLRKKGDGIQGNYFLDPTLLGHLMLLVRTWLDRDPISHVTSWCRGQIPARELAEARGRGRLMSKRWSFEMCWQIQPRAEVIWFTICLRHLVTFAFDSDRGSSAQCRHTLDLSHSLFTCQRLFRKRDLIAQNPSSPVDSLRRDAAPSAGARSLIYVLLQSVVTKRRKREIRRVRKGVPESGTETSRDDEDTPEPGDIYSSLRVFQEFPNMSFCVTRPGGSEKVEGGPTVSLMSALLPRRSHPLLSAGLSPTACLSPPSQARPSFPHSIAV